MIDPYSPWKKYFDFKKYSASMQCAWQKCGSAAPDTVIKNGLTEGATYIKFGLPTALGVTDPPVPLQVGNFLITWYVKVRGAQW
jgi:hypothetical protein